MGKPGKRISLREAAEKLVVYLPKFIDAIDYYGIDGYYRSCYKDDLKELHGRMDFLKSALASPARNCDVGTADEQLKRHEKWCDAIRNGQSGYHCSDAPSCSACFAKWSQMPYE